MKALKSSLSFKKQFAIYVEDDWKTSIMLRYNMDPNILKAIKYIPPKQSEEKLDDKDSRDSCSEIDSMLDKLDIQSINSHDSDHS